jgi:hypothetical protein
MTKLATALLLLAGVPAFAQQPVQKQGQCPIGYYTQYGYCVPFSTTQQPAVKKTSRDCPIGWYTQGDYCVRFSR